MHNSDERPRSLVGLVWGATCLARDWMGLTAPRRADPRPGLADMALGAWLEISQRMLHTARSVARSWAPTWERLQPALLRKWGVLGLAERLRAQSFAQLVVEQMYADSVKQLTQTEEVKKLVREQSLSLGSSALEELRSQSARADGLAERWVGRLFRRSPPRQLEVDDAGAQPA